MANVHMPPEMEADVQALAEETQRDFQAVFEEVVRDGISAARKRVFDQRLQVAHDQILAGEFVTEEESLAGLEE